MALSLTGRRKVSISQCTTAHARTAAMARKRMRARADTTMKKSSADALGKAEAAAQEAAASAAKKKKQLAKKPQVERIRELETELQSQGSAKVNNLVTLLESMRADDPAVAKAALHSLRRLFTGSCSALEAATHPASSGADAADANDAAAKAASIYETWVRGRYADYKQALLVLLNHSVEDMQIVATVVLMQLVKQESALQGGDAFAVDTFAQVVRALVLHTSHNTEDVVKMFVRSFASEYDDVRYHTLKAAKGVLGGLRRKSAGSEESAEPVHRALTLLLSIRMPAAATSDVLDNFWCPPVAPPADDSEQGPKKKKRKNAEPKGKRVNQVRSHRKAFADCWMELLQIQGLDVAAYRRVLLGMHDHILPHLPHPLLLSDFLTDAYNHGGAVSMLAMHGLFILMAKHGLEYPQFYPRLYALMTPSIFHLAHRDQFFRLTDLFLTSKGLPVYIAAAFIKRMAQLALTAPPAGCMLLLPCIYNLLQRHPTCKCMIHRDRKRIMDGSESSTTASYTDPFVADEDEPAKANALDSSLWELEALKRHSFPPVAKFVKVFMADFTKPVRPRRRAHFDHSCSASPLARSSLT